MPKHKRSANKQIFYVISIYCSSKNMRIEHGMFEIMFEIGDIFCLNTDGKCPRMFSRESSR